MAHLQSSCGAPFMRPRTVEVQFECEENHRASGVEAWRMMGPLARKRGEPVAARRGDVWS